MWAFLIFFLFLEQSSFPLKPLFVAFARFKRQHLEMKTHRLLQNYSRFRSRFLLTWRRDGSFCSSEFQLCCLLNEREHTQCVKKEKEKRRGLMLPGLLPHRSHCCSMLSFTLNQVLYEVDGAPSIQHHVDYYAYTYLAFFNRNGSFHLSVGFECIWIIACWTVVHCSERAAYQATV